MTARFLIDTEGLCLNLQHAARREVGLDISVLPVAAYSQSQGRRFVLDSVLARSLN